MIDTLLAFIDEKQLWGPLVQLAGALIAFSAVIVTQLMMNTRSERDIQARLEHIKLQHLHDERLKTKEIRLKKIEEILEEIQNARLICLKTGEQLDSTYHWTYEELESFYFHQSTELMISLRKIDLLTKLHLKDPTLSNFSYTNDRIPTEDGFTPAENLRNHILNDTLLKIKKLNEITEKLSSYVDIEN